MDSAATIVSRTKLDTHKFLALANEIVGRTVNAKADRAKNLHTPEADYTSFLSEILDPNGKPGLVEPHTGHCSVGVLAVCASDEIHEVITHLSGLHMLCSETVSRHHTMFVASGNLPTWQQVVSVGLGKCEVFELIRQAFAAENLDLWK